MSENATVWRLVPFSTVLNVIDLGLQLRGFSSGLRTKQLVMIDAIQLKCLGSVKLGRLCSVLGTPLNDKGADLA